MRRLAAGVAALLVVLAVAGGAWAPAAGAHATVLETVPANGATLDRAPDRVELTFNESVESRFGALQVVDARGRRVDDETIVRPSSARIAVGLRSGIADGSYAATYRVVSADGHPISGGISFAIGAPSAGGAVDVSRALADAGAPAGIGTALSVARAVRYAGIAAVVGLVLFLLVAWRPAQRTFDEPDDAESAADGLDGGVAATSRPIPGPGSVVAAPPEIRARLVRTTDRWARAAALLGAVGVATTFVLQGANVAGTGLLPALKPSAWGDVAQTRTGLWLLVALCLLLVLAILLPWAGGRLRAGRVTPVTGTVGVLTLLLAMTPALGGHAAASHPAVVIVALQAAHVVAMGAWLGGLLLLGLLLRALRPDSGALPNDGTASAADPAWDAALRTRLRVAFVYGFGPLAIAAVATLVVAGVVLSIVQLSAVGDLLDSAYGRAVLLKALLTAAAVAVALVQRRRMAPRVAAALADPQRPVRGPAAPGGAGEIPSGRAAATASDDAGRTVRRLIAVEVGLLTAVLAATGALAGYGQPGRTGPASPPITRGAAGPAVHEVTVDGRRLLRLELDPGAAGANRIIVRAVGVDGRPDRAGRDLRVQLTAPDGRQLDPPLRRVSRGRWVADGVPLAPAGRWTARLQLRTSAFDEDDVTLEVPVR